MKSWYLAIYLFPALVCMILAPLPLHASRNIVPIKITDSSGHEVGGYSGSHALLVGVSDYTAGWPDLASVDGELDKVARLLEARGFTVKRVRNPNGREMESAFEDFIYDYGYDRDNRLLFYFSGHGYSSDEGRKGYLVPADAPDPRKDERDFRRKALDMSRLLALSREMTAKHALFLFDSCFSGTIFKTKALPDTPPQITRATALPVRQFITAGEAGEEVPANSVFTPAFVDALEYGWGDLNKDGFVTGMELGLYLQGAVPLHARQTPQFGKIQDYELSRGDFVLLAGSSSAVIDEPATSRDSSTGTLIIEPDREQAEVYVDGRLQGRGRVELHLPPGNHQVRVSLNGYAAYKRRVELAAGRTRRLQAFLEPETVSGRLYVNATPSDAAIKILNIGPGYRPGIELAPGRYHLRAEKAGFEAQEQWVELRAGEDLDVAMRLEKKAGPTLGETWNEPVTGMQFVWVPGGCFQMGQTQSEKQRIINEAGLETYDLFKDELPRHKVCVDGFWMGKYEVTRDQFRRFVDDTGYQTDAERHGKAYISTKATDWKWKEESGYSWRNAGFDQNDRHPATVISHNDAQAFVTWLTGRSDGSFRLPTEAEWEYAARAGSTGNWFWGDSEFEACRYANAGDSGNGWTGAFPCDDGYEFTSPVGTYMPNAFGLHDMVGNLYEWCEDWYDEKSYSRLSGNNPVNTNPAKYRVLRGSCWSGSPRVTRSAYRFRNTPDYRATRTGFRVVSLPRN